MWFQPDRFQPDMGCEEGGAFLRGGEKGNQVVRARAHARYLGRN